jgi:hypothetical protein
MMDAVVIAAEGATCQDACFAIKDVCSAIEDLRRRGLIASDGRFLRRREKVLAG